VKVGDTVKAGSPMAKLGNSGPSEGPHLHLGLLDKADSIAGRSLPFIVVKKAHARSPSGFLLAGT
jgi:murein DD-endopeptidase MepM/ murein hydrolase activator NlpD